MPISWQRAVAALDLALDRLHVGYPGVSTDFARALGEAARVCLDERGHTSPTVVRIRGEVHTDVAVKWLAVSEQARRTWADPEVATEHGAYGIACLVVVELSDMTIVERSRKGTGFDFWLGDKAHPGPLFQGSARLEVSGIRQGSESAIANRVNRKVAQVGRSGHALPAVIVVVEFGGPQCRVRATSNP